MKNFLSLIRVVPLLFSILYFLPITNIYPQQVSLWDQVPEEIRERNSFKRFEWFYRQRAYPYDTVSVHTYLNELEA